MSWVPGKVVHFAPSALAERTACRRSIDALDTNTSTWTASHRDEVTCHECRAVLVEKILTRPTPR